MNELTEKVGRRRFLIASTAAIVAARQVLARTLGDKPSSHWPEIVRVGMIGMDGHYSEITAAARAWPTIRVTAIAERDPGLRKKAAQDNVLAGATMYEDHRALLEREKLDVVAVCGQNGVRAS